MKWRWIDKNALLLLHAESLAEHGGPAGLRDEGLLDSALARPQHLITYGKKIDAAQIAAAYAYGLARNHPFADGNKRAAFMAAGLFLRINGYRLKASQMDATRAVISLAAAELDEAGFAQWLRERVEKNSKS